jgi:hypothetical protein
MLRWKFMPNRLPAQGVSETEGLRGKRQTRWIVRLPAPIETVVQDGKTEPC